MCKRIACLVVLLALVLAYGCGENPLVAEIEEQVSSLEGQVRSLEQENSSLEGQVASVEQENSSLEQQKSSLVYYPLTSWRKLGILM